VSDPEPRRNPPAPEESVQLPSSRKHGRQRKRKKSKRLKNFITVVVFFFMIVVIIWFAVRAISGMGGGHNE